MSQTRAERRRERHERIKRGLESGKVPSHLELNAKHRERTQDERDLYNLERASEYTSVEYTALTFYNIDQALLVSTRTDSEPERRAQEIYLKLADIYSRLSVSAAMRESNDSDTN